MIHADRADLAAEVRAPDDAHADRSRRVAALLTSTLAHGSIGLDEDDIEEERRLLYVGITRAKKELILTWNTGRSREAKQMAVPMIALHTLWKEQQEERLKNEHL